MCCGGATTLYGTKTITTSVATAYLTVTSLRPFGTWSVLTQTVCVSYSNNHCVSTSVYPVTATIDYFSGLQLTTTVTGAVPVVTAVVVPTATMTVPCSKRDLFDVVDDDLQKRSTAEPTLKITSKAGFAICALLLSSAFLF